MQQKCLINVAQQQEGHPFSATLKSTKKKHNFFGLHASEMLLGYNVYVGLKDIMILWDSVNNNFSCYFIIFICFFT